MNNDAQKQVVLGTLANIEAESLKEKFPSFRFSEEISYMVTVLNQQLRGLKCSVNKEETVCSQILGLVFGHQTDKIWKSYDLFLYPYLSKIKLLAFVGEQIKSTHQQNIENVIHCFVAFMAGELPFMDSANELWCKDLHGKVEG